MPVMWTTRKLTQRHADVLAFITIYISYYRIQKSFKCEDEMKSSEGLVFLPNRLKSSTGYV